MHNVISIGLIFINASNFGEAPKETLDPVQCLRSLTELYSNCTFTATQEFHTTPPVGSSYDETTEIRAWVCAEAVEIQSKIKTSQSELANGGSALEKVRYTERRWLKTESALVVELGKLWPMTASTSLDVPVNSIMAYPQTEGDLNIVWGNILLRNFAPTNQPTAITFLDMVTEGGRHGYSFQSATWASPDHKLVTYRFAAPHYGSTSVTFIELLDHWTPRTISIVKSSDDKIYATSDPATSLVKNSFPQSDFRSGTTAVNRLEVTYDIQYDGLPCTITRTETRSADSQHFILTSTLNFISFECGTVELDDVRSAMLPLTDGTQVLFSDNSLGKLAWVIKNGVPVKQIDHFAAASNLDARFSASSKAARWKTIVALNIVAIASVAAVALFRRHSKRAQ